MTDSRFTAMDVQLINRWFAVFLVFGLVALVTTACPSQCECVPSRMSCVVPGLTQLPDPSSSQLEHLHLKNQTFRETHLGPAELKIYRAPEFGGRIRLKSLSIRACNIQTIGKFAFKELGYKLELVDLTGNPLIHVDDYAFADLGYLTLSLNEMKRPTFGEHAFSGLAKMKALFLQHSEMETLPYEALLELTTQGRLDNLFVVENRFTVLDEKYDAIFSRVQNFNINDNPWHCGCELNWLVRRYQRLLREKIKAHSARSQDSNTAPWEEKQPSCYTPSHLTGRNFSDLITDIGDIYAGFHLPKMLYRPPSVVHCAPPELQGIEINLKHYNEHGTPQSGLVGLKCVMKGSRKLNVFWGQTTTDNRVRYLAKGNRSGPSRFFSASNTNFLNTIAEEENMMEVEAQIRPESDLDTYFCLGADVIGNSSTVLRIRWPRETPHSFIDSRITTATTFENKQDVKPTTPEWTKEVLLPSYSVLHEPQFSLSQLLGAIAGTFVSTILLFFLIHRALHFHWTACTVRGPNKPVKSGITVSQHTRISPGETSSSNTSSNTRLLSPLTSCDAYPNTNSNQISPESQSITANLLNARAYHQLMNGAAGLSFTTLPLEFGVTPPMSTQYAHHSDPRNKPMTFPSETSANTLSGSYEPVSYSDTNNMTYDVPWSVNPMDRSQVAGYSEQNAPLLFSNPHSPFGPSNIVQSALMIPPPPSMPQPPTPQSGITNAVLNTAPASSTNLLMLQATYPAPQTGAVSTTNTSCAMAPSGSVNPNVMSGASNHG